MTENVPKLKSDTKTQIQEAQKTSGGQYNLHVGISSSNYQKIKDKEEILKEAREK